jgi:alpha/beta superfamily hydrolase
LRALWFGSEASLIGHLHTPTGEARDLCVVICPVPFGYENICSHRALRVLADHLARAGIASLRFDFPGTGDSDGVHDVEAWLAAVGHAVATARRETGCSRIALIGAGFGGTIALAALDRGIDVDQLVMWGAPSRGRAWLREQRAFHKVAVPEGSLRDPRYPPAPPTPEGIEELSGFPMTTEVAAAISALDLSKPAAEAWAPGRVRPATLVITRYETGDEKTLAAAMTARGITPTLEVRDGFGNMFAEPHLSTAPVPIVELLRDWLGKDAKPRAPYPQPEPPANETLPAGAAVRIGKDGLVEEIARYKRGADGLLFSIETRPVGRPPEPTWLVFLTGRAVRHVGPNRIWVRFAREMAKKGYATLRLDGRSVGDSDGDGNGLMPNEEYYQEHIYDDIEDVMQLATAQGARQFFMSGICSGATAAFQVAWRRNDVRGVVLLNLLQLKNDPEDDRDRYFDVVSKFVLRKELLLNPNSYKRLWKEGLPPKIREMAFNRSMLTAPLAKVRAAVGKRLKGTKSEESYIVRGYNGLPDHGTELDVFLSDSRAMSFIDRHFGGDLAKMSPRVRVHRVYQADHTIQPLFAQDVFFGLLRDAIARVSLAAKSSDPSSPSTSAGPAVGARSL